MLKPAPGLLAYSVSGATSVSFQIGLILSVTNLEKSSACNASSADGAAASSADGAAASSADGSAASSAELRHRFSTLGGPGPPKAFLVTPELLSIVIIICPLHYTNIFNFYLPGSIRWGAWIQSRSIHGVAVVWNTSAR